jgi:hypothetical protein
MLGFKLRIVENGKDVGKGKTVTVKPVREKCLVLGVSIIRNVGAEKSNMGSSVSRVLELINCEE